MTPAAEQTKPGEPPRTPPPPTGPRTPPPPTGPKKAEGRQAMGTAEEVAAYLQVPVSDLYQWRHKGTGPRASKVGRYLRYRWADVEKWLDAQAKAA